MIYSDENCFLSFPHVPVAFFLMKENKCNKTSFPFCISEYFSFEITVKLSQRRSVWINELL